MTLERWIALIVLAVCLIYGYAAYTYPLLPFERNMAFLPNTLPLALSVLGVLVALVIVVSPAPHGRERGDLRATIGGYRIGQTLTLIAAMVGYALLLRPLGFLLATTLFIAGSSRILGERRYHVLLPLAIFAAVCVWYLVQELLGIFLQPWPAFL